MYSPKVIEHLLAKKWYLKRSTSHRDRLRSALNQTTKIREEKK